MMAMCILCLRKPLEKIGKRAVISHLDMLQEKNMFLLLSDLFWEFERLNWEYTDSCFETWTGLKTKYGKEIGSKTMERISFNKLVEKYTGKKLNVEAPIAQAFKKKKKIKLVIVDSI